MRISSLLAPIIGLGYRLTLKPLLFKQDPELVHDNALKIGAWFGAKKYRRSFVSACFSYEHDSLKQELAGLSFKSPVGLAAGFDKNANLVNVLPSLSFGFGEIGSVTGRPCAGNPKPRLWRLPQSKSLAIFYGLANEGAAVVAARAEQSNRIIPLGINIAKTNDALTDDTQAGIDDYITAWRAVEKVANYITINISCPNTSGGQPFIDPILLERLLSAIGLENDSKPIFIKLSPDLDETKLNALLEVISRHRIKGLICTNLTHSRQAVVANEENIKTKGGLSGQAVKHAADELLSSVYKKTNGRYILIGCGGVFSAADAYEKIKRGANLVQLITGMIYNGPQFINTINRGLVKLLKKDGYENISQAVGAYHRRG